MYSSPKLVKSFVTFILLTMKTMAEPNHALDAPLYLGRKALSSDLSTRTTTHSVSRDLQDNTVEPPRKLYRRVRYPKGARLDVPHRKVAYGDLTKYAYIRADGFNVLSTTDAIVVMNRIGTGAIVGVLDHQEADHPELDQLHALRQLLAQGRPWGKAIIFKFHDDIHLNGLWGEAEYEVTKRMLRAAGVEAQNVHEVWYAGGSGNSPSPDGEKGGVLVVTKTGKVYMRNRLIEPPGWY